MSTQVNEKAKELAVELLEWAGTVESLPRRPIHDAWALEYYLLQLQDVPQQKALRAVMLALSIGTAAQDAIVRTSRVFSDATLHPDVQDSPKKKPRITLHALLNGAHTLELYWDNTPQKRWRLSEWVDKPDGANKKRSDFLEIGSTWTTYDGGALNCLLRLLADREYFDRIRFDDDQTVKDAEKTACNALERAFMAMAQSLCLMCDVTIEGWPVYTGPKLEIESRHTRATRQACERRQVMQKKVERAQRDLDARLVKIGVSNAEEFIALQCEAEKAGAPLAQFISSKKARRVSVTQTTGIELAMARLHTPSEKLAMLDETLSILGLER